MAGGGSLTDVGARGDYWVRSNLSLSASVQYERWLFPVIQPNASTNISATVEILFQPQKLFWRSALGGDATTSENGGRPWTIRAALLFANLCPSCRRTTSRERLCQKRLRKTMRKPSRRSD